MSLWRCAVIRSTPLCCFFFFALPQPPPSTLFPYTTLFRSPVHSKLQDVLHRGTCPSPGGWVRAEPIGVDIDWLRPNPTDRKSTRLNSSHVSISYAVFCLKKKKNTENYCNLSTTQTNPNYPQ